MHVHIAWVRTFELLPSLLSSNAADSCPVALRGPARSPSAHPEMRPIFRGDESSAGCSCVRQVAGVGRDLGKRAIAGPRSARANLAALAIPVPDPTARSLRMPRQVQQSAVQVQSTTHSYCDAHLAAIWRDFFGQPTVCTVPHV